MAVEPAKKSTTLSCGFADEALATASLGNMAIVLWRGEKTAERAAHEQACLRAVAESHPGDLWVLFVITASAPPPSEPMRRAAADMVSALADDLQAVAVVIEGTGFAAAVTRAVLTTMERLTGGHRFPSRYFGDLASASAWLVGTRAEPRSDAIVGALDVLRGDGGDTLVRARQR